MFDWVGFHMIRRDVEDIVSREIHLAAAVQGLFSVWFLFLEGLNFIETFICARARVIVCLFQQALIFRVRATVTFG